MSEHLSSSQVVNYCRQKLAPAELLGADDHMAECVECRRLVESRFNIDAMGLYADLAAQAAVGPHLTFDQSAAYVDGMLTGEERRMVEDHLASCARCAPITDDLLAFRNEIAPELDREYGPAPARPVTEESRWRRFIQAVSEFGPRSPALVFGSALAAILLMVAGRLIWRAITHKEEKPDITRTSPSPATPTITPVVSPSAPAGVAGETLLARLNDGAGQLTLDRDGNLTGVDNLPPAYRQMIKGALTNQRLERSPLLAGLPRPGSLATGTPVIRGPNNQNNGFSVIAPVGKVTLSDRPALQWSRLEGATSYIVEIYDNSFKLISKSPPLAGNKWTPPEKLKRGGIFSWQVRAVKDGQEFISPLTPAPPAKFRILDRARANELTRARSVYASSHLTLALLYAQAGLLDEAENEFRELQKANPDSAIPRRLLDNLRAMRR
jgi:hypothetical protein